MIAAFNPTPTSLKPMTIGGVVIDTPLTLAPMAGHTNHAFRVLCREMGDCGLVCTELLSGHIVQERSSRSFKMFDWSDVEHPFAVQLFGSDPTMMAEAARIVADAGADIIDINMGCWVPKLVKKGAGAALLRDVCTATLVVGAVVKAVDIPVTVKVRSGWDAEQITAVEFARAAESVGVQAVAVHGRTAAQGFSGTADWDIIRQVKEAVKYIPVIGNGDVYCAADAAKMFAETGCDAVMLGRAALGNPWIFRQITHELTTGEALPLPTLAERAAVALRHARLTIETTYLNSERQAVYELRGQISKYRLDAPGTVAVRNQLVQAESLADIESILLPLVEG
jgi:tRNA-dihydrouridine synthase B